MIILLSLSLLTWASEEVLPANPRRVFALLQIICEETNGGCHVAGLEITSTDECSEVKPILLRIVPPDSLTGLEGRCSIWGSSRSGSLSSTHSLRNSQHSHIPITALSSFSYSSFFFFAYYLRIIINLL
jgi:hypothetical protein